MSHEGGECSVGLQDAVQLLDRRFRGKETELETVRQRVQALQVICLHWNVNVKLIIEEGFSLISGHGGYIEEGSAEEEGANRSNGEAVALHNSALHMKSTHSLVPCFPWKCHVIELLCFL